MAAIDQETTDALDKVFNAWLALNSILSHEGKLYKSDPTGQIIRDANGSLLTVNPEQFKLLMQDPVIGLQAYAAKQGLHLKPTLQDFPAKN